MRCGTAHYLHLLHGRGDLQLRRQELRAEGARLRRLRELQRVGGRGRGGRLVGRVVGAGGRRGARQQAGQRVGRLAHGRRVAQVLLLVRAHAADAAYASAFAACNLSIILTLVSICKDIK